MNAKRHTLANAMRVAAEVYDRDSVNFEIPARTRDQFLRQAFEARKLADEIEQADAITLED